MDTIASAILREIAGKAQPMKPDEFQRAHGLTDDEFAQGILALLSLRYVKLEHGMVIVTTAGVLWHINDKASRPRMGNEGTI